MARSCGDDKYLLARSALRRGVASSCVRDRFRSGVGISCGCLKAGFLIRAVTIF